MGATEQEITHTLECITFDNLCNCGCEDQLRAALSSLQQDKERLVEALKPFAKMADALIYIDDEVVVTNETLPRTRGLPNYGIATRDLRNARAALEQVKKYA